jgi:hypothetical protein
LRKKQLKVVKKFLLITGQIILKIEVN